MASKDKPMLLLDGDLMLHQFCTVCEHEIAWEDEVHSLHSDMPKIRMLMRNRIVQLKELYGTDSIIVCLSSSSNFRKKLYAPYKSSRRNTRKPLCFKAAKEWVASEFPTVILEDIEADDCLGILSTAKASSFETSLGIVELPSKRIIVSEDKDFEQIPGYIWNPKKDKATGVREIPLAQANYRFFLQTLMGDAIDSYPGCPGLGPTTASKVLLSADCRDVPKVWKLVVDTYKSKGLTEEDALVQARCARILRAEDYNYKERKVILWTPK